MLRWCVVDDDDAEVMCGWWWWCWGDVWLMMMMLRWCVVDAGIGIKQTWLMEQPLLSSRVWDAGTVRQGSELPRQNHQWLAGTGRAVAIETPHFSLVCLDRVNRFHKNSQKIKHTEDVNVSFMCSLNKIFFQNYIKVLYTDRMFYLAV